MTRFAGKPVPVTLPGGCQCPGQPHEQDQVYLHPRLTFEGGVEGDRAVARVLGSGDIEAAGKAVTEVYLRHQVAGWNLLEEDGSPMPYSADRLMTDYEASRAVADAADGLYSEALLAPLVAAVSTSSSGGQTAPSTSPRTRTASTRRKR